jgi:hypothetical protein
MDLGLTATVTCRLLVLVKLRLHIYHASPTSFPYSHILLFTVLPLRVVTGASTSVSTCSCNGDTCFAAFKRLFGGAFEAGFFAFGRAFNALVFMAFLTIFLGGFRVGSSEFGVSRVFDSVSILESVNELRFRRQFCGRLRRGLYKRSRV